MFHCFLLTCHWPHSYLYSTSKIETEMRERDSFPLSLPNSFPKKLRQREILTSASPLKGGFCYFFVMSYCVFIQKPFSHKDLSINAFTKYWLSAYLQSGTNPRTRKYKVRWNSAAAFQILSDGGTDIWANKFSKDLSPGRHSSTGLRHSQHVLLGMPRIQGPNCPLA